MKSVINNEKEIIVKNSRFICMLFNVNDIDDVNKYVEIAKNKYKNATHYCYAYIIDSYQKCSDDGEPSSTAGMPMLEVLKKNDLNNVLAITIRYFGGIKLGAGGLVRAYTKSVTNALDGSIKDMVMGYNITIKFSYNLLKKIDYLLKDYTNINKNFDEDIVYSLDVTVDTYEAIKNIPECNIIINKKTYL